MFIGSVSPSTVAGSEVQAQPEKVAASAPSFEALLKSNADAAARQTTATRTRLTATEARDALSQAWTEKFGSPPSAETSAILTAQWSHETGGGQSMWNYNFAGIKGSGPTGLYVSQRTKEGYGNTEHTITDHFRAYESKEDGARDYLALLTRRYGTAIEAASAGNPEEFVRELKKGGYFTGSEAAYTRSVSSLTASILGRDPVVTSPTVAVPRPEATEGVGRIKPSLAAPTESAMALAANQVRPERQHHIDSSNAPELSLPNVEMFHEALSRAALQIALAPDRREEREL